MAAHRSHIPCRDMMWAEFTLLLSPPSLRIGLILADRIIGVMFAGLLAGAFVLFDKLSNKLFNKQD